MCFRGTRYNVIRGIEHVSCSTCSSIHRKFVPAGAILNFIALILAGRFFVTSLCCFTLDKITSSRCDFLITTLIY